ncbi:MAG: FISUMP domain-containing protein [Candidatus Falkowbacteria bacterium]
MKQASFKEAKSGFTLIELLVVIAIIGILATISVLALSNARSKSRDAKRAGDMKQVQTALELFFNDRNRYPTTAEWNTGQIFSTTTDATSTYMQVIPLAPTPADGSCSNNQNTISYTPSADGSTYLVSFCLGNTTGTLTPGPKCLTPGGIVDTDCSISEPVGDSFSCPEAPIVYYTGGRYDANGLSTTTGGYYRTVKIGTQCWLRDNLNVGTMKCPGDTSNTCTQDLGDAQGGNFEKYCYSNNNGQDYCATEGGLYQWHVAMGFPTSCDRNSTFTDNGNGTYTGGGSCAGYTINVNHQGICPTGWHIPSNSDFDVLTRFVISDPSCNPYAAAGCPPAGTRLKKATDNVVLGHSGCSNGSSECGQSGFEGLLAGGRWPWSPYDFRGRNAAADFWSSTPGTATDKSYSNYLHYTYTRTDRDYYERFRSPSVRCVKNL